MGACLQSHFDRPLFLARTNELPLQVLQLHQGQIQVLLVVVLLNHQIITCMFLAYVFFIALSFDLSL